MAKCTESLREPAAQMCLQLLVVNSTTELLFPAQGSGSAKLTRGLNQC